MKTRSRFAPLLLAALLLGPTAATGLLPAGETAPDFTLPDGDGNSRSLDDYRGDVVLVHFWASWCGPCVKELPDLNALQRRFADRGVTFLAISTDSSADAAREKAEQLGPDLQLLLDPDRKVAEAYEASALPTSYLVDPDANIVLAKRGSFSGKALRDLAERIERLARPGPDTDPGGPTMVRVSARP